MSVPYPNALLVELERLERIQEIEPGAEHRYFERSHIRSDALIERIKPRPTDDRAIHALLHDISLGGLGFLCQSPLLVHSVWVVTIRDGGYPIAQQPIAIEHCSKVNDHAYLIGSQFCVATGFLSACGIDPQSIHTGDEPTDATEPDSRASHEAA